MDASAAEDRTSRRWDRFRRLTQPLQPRFDQFDVAAVIDHHEPIGIEHVPDPIPFRPIGQRKDELVASFEDVDRRSIRPSRHSPSIDDDAEVGSASGEGPKDRVRDELVEAGKPRREGHAQTIVG